jgi:hypothetical protein
MGRDPSSHSRVMKHGRIARRALLASLTVGAFLAGCEATTEIADGRAGMGGASGTGLSSGTAGSLHAGSGGNSGSDPIGDAGSVSAGTGGVPQVGSGGSGGSDPLGNAGTVAAGTGGIAEAGSSGGGGSDAGAGGGPCEVIATIGPNVLIAGYPLDLFCEWRTCPSTVAEAAEALDGTRTCFEGTTSVIQTCEHVHVERKGPTYAYEYYFDRITGELVGVRYGDDTPRGPCEAVIYLAGERPRFCEEPETVCSLCEPTPEGSLACRLDCDCENIEVGPDPCFGAGSCECYCQELSMTGGQNGAAGGAGAAGR